MTITMLQQAQVAAMHAAFGHPVGDRPQLISEQRAHLRHALIQEELDEYLAAFFDHNLVEVADALGDLLVVVLGAAVEHGIDLGPVFDRIMESNMSKLGEDGKPVPHPDIPGKFGKGPNYQPPTQAIAREIARQVARQITRPRLRVGDRVKVIYEGEVTRIVDVDGHERFALWEDDEAAKIHVGERGHVVVTHLMHDRRNRVVPARPWWRFW